MLPPSRGAPSPVVLECARVMSPVDGGAAGALEISAAALVTEETGLVGGSVDRPLDALPAAGPG